jgi:hypothetical protein
VEVIVLGLENAERAKLIGRRLDPGQHALDDRELLPRPKGRGRNNQPGRQSDDHTVGFSGRIEEDS